MIRHQTSGEKALANHAFNTASMRVRILLVGMLAAALLAAIPAMPHAADTGVLRLQVVSCAEGMGERPGVAIAPAAQWPHMKYRPTASRVADNGNGVEILDVPVRQGNWFVRVQTPHCARSVQAGVLAGHTRTVAIVLGRNCKLCGVGMYVYTNVLMGTLPLSAPTIYLYADGRRRVLDVQDGAFYLEGVPPVKAVLQIQFQQGEDVRVDVDLRHIGQSGVVIQPVDLGTIRKSIAPINCKPTMLYCT